MIKDNELLLTIRQRYI